jgi:nitrogen fixation/metabolism regulation signal transduction histidine kinase
MGAMTARDAKPDTKPKRRLLGTTARRVASAIFITALVPLVAGTWLARTLVARVSATAFQPEFGEHLDQALGVYADLAKSMKAEMRAEGDAIAASAALAKAARDKDPAALGAELERTIRRHKSLAEITLKSCRGKALGQKRRGAPVDPKTERSLVVHPWMIAEARDDLACESDTSDEPFQIDATFVAPRARLDELEGLQAFTQAYHQIEKSHREEYLDQTYSKVIAALFFLTLGLAALAGTLVVRPVTRRIAALADATRPVAEGDLSVRVAFEGDDEVAELGRAFDRMLEELSQSRARVEFLKRVGEWQKMARRLAHEIKNPLTPIQLAVEECHKRYKGDDPDFKRILQTTFEVVEEEVGSLRRLVTEFSSFARLPRAILKPGDLGVFLREQAERWEARDSSADDARLLSGVAVSFIVRDEPMPLAMDEEMLRRVIGNIVRNAAQAIRDTKGAQGAAQRGGKVIVNARVQGDAFVVDIDDDGPGIPAEVAQQLFDPYVTTKRDGTGLGLSIVKKIVVDHGGSIEAGKAPLGGARFHLVLPREGSADAKAALERAEPSPESIRAAG